MAHPPTKCLLLLVESSYTCPRIVNADDRNQTDLSTVHYVYSTLGSVVIPTDALTGGTAKKTAFCNQFWTFNCDGDGDERCQTLNPRVCAPSGKRLDRCALLKSKGGDNYKKCRPTEVQAADLVRDFEADDSFDNWFSGECSSGNGVEVKFKVPSGEDKTLDGCAEAEKSKE